MTDLADVVIVGGGIGGASLAYALARSGLGTTVIEASVEFEDRVRGESLQAWGVQEARDLGVEELMLDAGAHIAPVWKQYVEGIDEAGELPMGMMIPEIPGTLNLRHPVACQALLDAAAGAGARVVRGVRDVRVTGGESPMVAYANGEHEQEIRTSLVVGADGRRSTVRKQIGIVLERQQPMSYIAGLLIEGLNDVPDDFDVIVSEGDLFFVMFHQGGGRARVYLCPGLSGKHRFAGPDGSDASWLRARCRAIRGVSKWSRRRPPVRARPTQATTRGLMHRIQKGLCSSVMPPVTTTRSSARASRSLYAMPGW